MTSPQSQPDTVALADELDRRLGAYLGSLDGGQNQVVNEVALRNALWGNKAGIIAALRATPAQPAGMREALMLIEECAAICDKHATWAEEKIERNPSSNASRLFATISNTAHNCAAMIRDLKALPEPAGVAQSAPVLDQAWRDSTWLGLSASEKACYYWPEDTDLHRQCRAAYIAGALLLSSHQENTP